MILQALAQYYEALLDAGKITRPGWAKTKVSFALCLDDAGQITQLLHLQKEIQRGKKTVLAPQELDMPSPVKRTVGVAANFLCDNSSYLLGADDKGKPARSRKCFNTAKSLHLALLKDVDSPAAQAIVRFFESWDPAQAAEHPALREDWADLMKGGNLTFWYQAAPAAADPAAAAIRERRRGGRGRALSRHRAAHNAGPPAPQHQGGGRGASHRRFAGRFQRARLLLVWARTGCKRPHWRIRRFRLRNGAQYAAGRPRPRLPCGRHNDRFLGGKRGTGVPGLYDGQPFQRFLQRTGPFGHTASAGKRGEYRLGSDAAGPCHPFLCSGPGPQRGAALGPFFLAEQLRHVGAQHRPPL